MPTFKYISDAFKFWTSIFSLISGTKMKFSINFAAMLNLVRQIKSSLNRKPSLELFDVTHAQYTYTYLLTGRVSKLGLHSLKSYTCVLIPRSLLNPFPTIHDNSHLLSLFCLCTVVGLYCKQYGSRSDCSSRSSLIRFHSVYFLDKITVKPV